jgi:hypothetical protein
MSLADEKEPLRVVWYGDPGSSKTTNLTDLAKRGRITVIDADAGMKGRALRDFDIPLEQIEPYREITYPALDGLFWDLKEAIADDPDYCVGLGLDTATEATQRLLGLIVDQKQGAKIARAEAQGLDSSDIDPFFRDRDFYGTLTEQFRRLLRGWKDIGINLGITAHVRRDVDEETRKVMYGPDVSPAIQGNLMGAMDVIAYCRVDGTWPSGYEAGGAEGMDVMVADMRATADHKAKDRFHATPRVMVNPTFTRIIDYVEGALTLDNDEEQAAYRELYKSRAAEAKAKRDERAARKAATAGKKTAAKKTSASKPDPEPEDGDDDEGGDED